MVNTLQLGAITVDVVKKDIKNVHLSVYPPTGKVRISAPLRMRSETIRVFAVSKLGWIKQQQKKVVEQERETPREYVERESHYLWGKRYLLKVVEHNAAPQVDLRHNKIVLSLRPETSAARRHEILSEWYRRQLRELAERFTTKWEPVIGVKVDRLFIQHMKTKWGSCSRNSANIRLNTDLAKKPQECLEYLVVHEMLHIIEPTHNSRFIDLMDRQMPNWRFYRQLLNRLPVRHESWDY
jgi:predicted metal-dependent hydrolase